MSEDQIAAVQGQTNPPITTQPERQAPDRNLALELARVTEAGAMAAARWVGRGDKNGADAAAVEAMRALINTVSMRGVVVIGEGEKDNAPMLYNGEQVGRRHRPGVRRRGGPDRRHPADGQRHAERDLGARGRARGSMYDPSAVFYMDKLVTGPAAADVVDIEAPVAAQHRRGGEGQGLLAGRTSPWSSSTGPGTRAHPRDPGGRRADQAHHRRRRRRRDHGRPRGHRRRPAARHRRHPGGHHRRLRRQVPGRGHPGQARPARRRRARRALDAGHDLDRVLTTDDLVASEDVFFAATGITDGELMRGCPLPGRRRRPPSRWSCGRARAPSGPSPASTSSGSCAPTARSTSTVPPRTGSGPGQVSGPAAGTSHASARAGGAAHAPAPARPRCRPRTSTSGEPGAPAATGRGSRSDSTRPGCRAPTTVTRKPSGTNRCSCPPIKVACTTVCNPCSSASRRSSTT